MLVRRRRAPVQINIVPLVDVLIVLIFFFLISMQFRDTTTLNISVPTIETAGHNRIEGQLEIAITEEGEFFFNGQVASEEQLEAAIKLAAQINKKQTVIIMADEDSFLKKTAKAMDLCRKHGLEQIRLQAR